MAPFRSSRGLLALLLAPLLAVAPVPGAEALTANGEVVMFWRTNTTFESVANSAYTLVFLSFAYIPDDNMFTMDLPATCTESNSPLGVPPVRFSCLDGIKALKAAGKKVGISVGGGDTVTKKVPRVFTTLYSLYNAVPSGNMTVITSWTKMIADFMDKWNLDAVDFDNEEAHTASTGGTADTGTQFEALADQGGLDFMALLQIGMRQAIGPSRIFTVSLQPPFYGAPTIEDPGAVGKFPVRPAAPWYNNLMYMFESNKGAYDALTYMIWMYYPKENMWEWVTSNDSLTHNIVKYTEAPHLLNSTVNLAEIYRSQLAVSMATGQVGRLDPKKMIIATQINVVTDQGAFVPAASLFNQLSGLSAAERPGGYGVWTEAATWSNEGCAWHAAVCQLVGVCASQAGVPCPPSAANAVPKFDAPATPQVATQALPPSSPRTATATRAGSATQGATGATQTGTAKSAAGGLREALRGYEVAIAVAVGVAGFFATSNL